MKHKKYFPCHLLLYSENFTWNNIDMPNVLSIAKWENYSKNLDSLEGFQ